MQAAIEDVYDDHQKIVCANMEVGAGIECISMSSIWANNINNDLAVYVRSLLLSENYSPSEIAILLEPHAPDKIEKCKQILADYVPDITVQSAAVFPRTGVIVDVVDAFIGLDACVCIFILSNARKESARHPARSFQRRTRQQEMNMYNPHYEVFLASRATHKAVFVVPELHEDLVQQMKFNFDHFQVCMYVVVIKICLGGLSGKRIIIVYSTFTLPLRNGASRYI